MPCGSNTPLFPLERGIWDPTQIGPMVAMHTEAENSTARSFLCFARLEQQLSNKPEQTLKNHGTTVPSLSFHRIISFIQL